MILNKKDGDIVQIQILRKSVSIVAG